VVVKNGREVNGAVAMRIGTGLGLALTVACAGIAAAAGDFSSEEIAGQFAAQSLPIPTTERVVICHGFACKFRTMVGFDAQDHAELRKIMGKVGTPEAERAAMAKAVSWYGRRIAPEAGTAGAKARPAPTKSGDPSQIDCVESSLNTTQILLILQELGLLRYHHVEPYVSRITFDFVHSTAVLSENANGKKWAVDTWVRDSGQIPDVRPLADWYKGD
jgi:hypothetical protein